MNCMLSSSAALTRYHNDGHVELDNDAAERALPAFPMGRFDNWHK